ncbi:MAG: hypothetical protein H6810_04475 [Phycisphaeraceae bacterium]|nr:MAG: hypothetical protein H6810_04475 [Phycisphaeraceae bacterium]
MPFPARCPACGYDLTGSQKFARCPECGTPAAVGEDCLAIAAVPRRSPGPVWRRVAWVFIGIGFVGVWQTWPLLLFRWPWLLGLLLLADVAAAAAMVLTGTPVSKATERIAFTGAGYIRSIWGAEGAKATQTTFHPWTGNDRVRIRRVGTVWQRLVIEQQGRAALDCGLRCPEDKIETLAACIRYYAESGFRAGGPEANPIDFMAAEGDETPDRPAEARD